MAWRQLPDGSYFDPNTGNLSGLDGKREAAARAVSATRDRPVTPSMVPSHRGPDGMIEPSRGMLAVNPFELGLGTMSPMVKRVATTGVIVAVIGGVCWVMAKMNKPGKKSKR